ncbi:uncharacterized protein LOC125275954 isoform X1 [Megalobrama amblycephala]|uniref:uncharacterized protein LOC125275949 n=1 Tax=Megalobrama amblycephala TaxID=75352 RepID=UPI002014144B|nr:uncharacterized protein LOC125275949 [Megalobrama amblycephala]XP_048059272.1 uncharacterized protein LOC125275954 isoform X1 [Megalobrama amblycephala]
MEKVIFIFCVFSYWIMQITPNAPESSDLLKVQMGEDITLNCSMTDRIEVAWFHLNSEKLKLLISAKKDRTGRKLLIIYKQNSTRLKITADSWVTTVSLIISGASESDLGFYFCGTKSNSPEMFFDKTIRLEIDGLFVAEESKEVVDITVDEVTPTERMLMFGGVGLAAFVFFLTTVIAGLIIYHRGWQKGLKEAKHEGLVN